MHIWRGRRERITKIKRKENIQREGSISYHRHNENITSESEKGFRLSRGLIVKDVINTYWQYLKRNVLAYAVRTNGTDKTC